eukprot:scaffold163534_cov35-Tisochrysis_lutea.AAC.4
MLGGTRGGVAKGGREKEQMAMAKESVVQSRAVRELDVYLCWGLPRRLASFHVYVLGRGVALCTLYLWSVKWWYRLPSPIL